MGTLIEWLILIYALYCGIKEEFDIKKAERDKKNPPKRKPLPWDWNSYDFNKK